MLLVDLPKARRHLSDRGYDAYWFCDALATKDIKPCIPDPKPRSAPAKHDERRSKTNNRSQTLFGYLKDWHHVATRYDRC